MTASDRPGNDEVSPAPFHRKWLLLAGLFGFLGVAAGAFAAHALATRLDEKHLDWWEKAARYQLYHAPVLAICALMQARGGERVAKVAGTSFTAGIVLFSGSLYAMALGAPTWLGAVTPFGGVAFLVGWGALFVAALRSPSSSRPGT